MTIKRQKTALIFLFLLFPSFLISGGKIKEKDLSEKYQEWLKLTSYIILPQEKEVFMQLTADRDRDLFMESFWNQRDPTPGTPQNEFKDEHIRRFQYANKFYRRSSPRAGWMTDMGRIYIILGKQVSIERIEGAAGVFPAQVWYYYGDKRKGLPTYFALVFYQRGGSGEYKLYNPVSDGPTSLLVDTEGLDLTDYQGVYLKIKELAPTLAGVSISMIPGQYPYNFQPSPSNNIIMAEIFESPKKEVNASYATHFLDYKGIVSTEYLTNYIESSAEVALIEDPILGVPFLHFSINPKSVSIDYFEPKDQYYCNFQLNVSLRRGEDIIYQYSKDFPFYFDPPDMERIKGSGISIQDSFPIIEGTYRLNILIQNSVGKEFSVYEKDVMVPEASGVPKIVGPVIGYELQDYQSSLHVPFRALDKKLLVDPQRTLGLSDNVAILFNLMNVSKELWEQGAVEVSIKGVGAKNSGEKSVILNLRDYPFNEILSLSFSLPAQELTPDYYELKLILHNGDREVLDERKENFILSPAESVPHPITLAKSFPLSNSFLYLYSMAYQYDKIGEAGKADKSFQKAYVLNPDYKPGLLEYARFLLKAQKLDKSLELVEKIKGESELSFDYYLVKGKALMEMGKYSEALENLLEGNKIYNSDTSLLNALGICYSRTGQKKKALEVLKASLRLNSEQVDVKKLIGEIEKSLD